MNYRHQYHAGNFADVVKHVVLVQLVRALQKKPAGFVYVDTHAGRGGYDLSAATRGDSLERVPEWPGGIGRLWPEPANPALRDYLDTVREYHRQRGGEPGTPQFYPGSPWIAAALARQQDRLVFCEQHPEELAALAAEFLGAKRTSVLGMDGYVGIRATLPPPERRALVLIDPSYEAPGEYAQVVAAVRNGLLRLTNAVIAVWYPLTARAQSGAFFDQLLTAPLPPTLAIELNVAGEDSPLKLRGCGVAVVNPPWQFEQTISPALDALRQALLQPGGGVRLEWLVRER